jgi:hypothetical protein
LTTPCPSTRISADWRLAVDPSDGGDAMTWEAPDFVEVKMDAEINSYQDDFGQEPDDRF